MAQPGHPAVLTARQGEESCVSRGKTSSALQTDTVVYNIPKCHCVMIAIL